MTDGVFPEIDYDVFDDYEAEIEKLQDRIRKDLPEAGEGTLDGREWCLEHDIPENAFADAINWMDDADYGVSPMYPWTYPDDQ